VKFLRNQNTTRIVRIKRSRCHYRSFARNTIGRFLFPGKAEMRSLVTCVISRCASSFILPLPSEAPKTGRRLRDCTGERAKRISHSEWEGRSRPRSHM
jgi:hypothetical protein